MPFGYSQPASWLREDEDFDRDNRPGAPDWFSLSGDVGFKRPNNRHDTFKVESLLGYGGYMDLEKSGGPLGLSNWGLEKPIKKFQEKNGLEVDGWLKPGGPTITKMKELYGDAFGGSLAPTPAMVDANAEAIHAGEDGFLYDKGPRFGVKPNKRLDGKAPLLEFERWNREWARGSGGNPTSLVPEYETYIRDVDDEHGHDPGLIFARDLAKQIERQHGPENAGEFAKAMIARLSDRPDLQRQFLGGPAPEAPPVGTFKPDGLERVQQWIDAARIAAGVLPKFAQAASAATGAAPAADTAGTSVPIASSASAQDQAPAMAAAPMPEDAALPDGWPTRRPATDVRWPESSYNLLDYVQTYGYPDEDPTQKPMSQAAEPGTAELTPAQSETGAAAFDPNETSMAGVRRRDSNGRSGGAGGADTYDPNQLNTEGTHRLPPPEISRGFEDEFPAPTPATPSKYEQQYPLPEPVDLSELDDAALDEREAELRKAIAGLDAETNAARQRYDGAKAKFDAAVAAVPGAAAVAGAAKALTGVPTYYMADAIVHGKQGDPSWPMLGTYALRGGKAGVAGAAAAYGGPMFYHWQSGKIAESDRQASEHLAKQHKEALDQIKEERRQRAQH